MTFTIENLKKIKKIHFIGIGGIGVSALARIMKHKNYEVTGSDLKSSNLTKQLQKEGIKVFYNQIDENITKDVELVVKTSAVKSNPETKKAQKLNIPILNRGEFLSIISNEYNLISVSGSHGKTTTSALITYALKQIKSEVSFNVGGILSNFNTNSDIKDSGVFVTEADESDGSFLNLYPNISLINNLDPEHLEYYGNFENLKKAFKKFSKQSNITIWNKEDKNLKTFMNDYKITFGLNENAYYYAKNIKENLMSTTFDFYKDNKKIKEFNIPLTGIYNVLNTVGAIGAVDQLKNINIMDLDFSGFKGVKRRCECVFQNKVKNISFYDDYAHHPIEISELFKNILRNERIVILYQPHRYSRTRDNFNEIVEVLKMPKNLVVLKEYSANETIIEGAKAVDLFNKLKKSDYEFLKFAENHKEAENFAQSVYDDNYILFSVGAGNVNEVLYSLAKKLS